MKRLFFVFAILFAIVATLPAQAQTAPKTLTLAWTNTDTAWGPTCPATAPKMCLGPITAEEITSLTPVIFSSGIACSATSFSYTYPQTPSYGNHTYAVVATGYDANGNAVQSSATSVVVDVEPALNAPVIGAVTVK